MIKQPKERTVRITRAFLMGGESVPVDTVITLDTGLASELIAANKAEETTEKPRAPRRRRSGQSAAADTVAGGIGSDDITEPE